ncbi:hypothetical protein MUK42_23620 [Musa troglodytarum]|uniref:Uncharacterized protein n=1 Tax=Musa troglodytarum TaxID=320322 RepID=A0A9E7LG06_9LILI|nr:hypothetical protein MUK42_23620 [Musa troglodytarum]
MPPTTAITPPHTAAPSYPGRASDHRTLSTIAAPPTTANYRPQPGSTPPLRLRRPRILPRVRGNLHRPRRRKAKNKLGMIRCMRPACKGRGSTLLDQIVQASHYWIKLGEGNTCNGNHTRRSTSLIVLCSPYKLKAKEWRRRLRRRESRDNGELGSCTGHGSGRDTEEEHVPVSRGWQHSL